jgi:hypothetical protein
MKQLKKLSSFNGGNLESAYDKFKAEYDDCEQQATAVRSQIREVDTVTRDLFREWERKARQYESATLAAVSRRKLAETKSRFDQLSRSLHSAESTMDPVLRQLRDQVLYLKHNLNAAAIGSLRGMADSIQGNIQHLLEQMNRSIAEGRPFHSDDVSARAGGTRRNCPKLMRAVCMS